MRTTPVDRLAHLGRAILLLGALLAGGVALLWTRNEEWVREFDARSVEEHIAAARDLDARTQSSEFSGSHRFVKVGLEVNELLRDIRPGERMDTQRRRALEYLARHQSRLGDLPEALESAREWVEFDPLSVRAVLELARLLGEFPELGEERLEVVHELFMQLPEVPIVARAWCELLMEEGRYLDAVEAALFSERQARPSFWRVRWKRREEATSPFQAMVRPELTPDGDLLLECTIGGPALWISIELPPGGECTLDDPVLTIAKKGSQENLVLADFEGATTVSLTRSGRSFTQTGALGARFVIEPGRAAVDQQPTLTFRAGFRRPPPAGLLAVALHPASEAALAELAAAGREQALALLRESRLDGLRGTKSQLYWRKPKGSFSAPHSVAVPLGGELVAGTLEFELEFPIGRRVSQLRLDLPEGLGVSYELVEVEVQTAEGGVLIDLATAELEQLHGLERTAATFKVTGSDPWLLVDLPQTEALVEQLRVRGVAR